MTDGRTTVIARTIARTVVPLIVVTSIALLFQGHNLPGGGFIAGVLTVTAFALLYVVYGSDSVADSLVRGGTSAEVTLLRGPPATYLRSFGVGLALAVGAGLAAMLLGLPFLSQGVVFLEHVPVFGELEIASALWFDLGVYFVVVGALLTILSVVGAE